MGRAFLSNRHKINMLQVYKLVDTNRKSGVIKPGGPVKKCPANLLASISHSSASGVRDVTHERHHAQKLLK